MSKRLTAEQVAQKFEATALDFGSLDMGAPAAMYRDAALFVRRELIETDGQRRERFERWFCCLNPGASVARSSDDRYTNWLTTSMYEAWQAALTWHGETEGGGQGVSDHKPHPLRIQRKRTKGWRLPDGAVCCTRPGPWGNPFASAARFHHELMAILAKPTGRSVAPEISDETYYHLRDIARHIGKLRGKSLACWCSLDKPCHVDVLAELANRPAELDPLATERLH